MSHTARSQRPRGKKRVRSEEDPATAQHAEKAAATDAPAQPAKKKYKRRQKRKSDAAEGDGAAHLDPEEQERRRVQKELRVRRAWQAMLHAALLQHPGCTFYHM